MVKTYMKSFNAEILPHVLHSPDNAPFDYQQLQLMAYDLPEQLFASHEDIKNMIKKMKSSSNIMFECFQEDGGGAMTSDSLYFE